MSEAFKSVYQRLLDLIPNLEMRPGHAVHAVRLVQEWIALDPTGEIIHPAINIAFARCAGKITSPSYFDKPIRLAIEASTNSAAHQERMIHSKAKTIRIMQRTGMYVSDNDEAFLAKYDADIKKQDVC